MNEGPINQGNAAETTDCLEAVGVFRGWKNFFFVVVLICLLLTQGAFWLVNLGAVEPAAPAPEADIREAAAEGIVNVNEPAAAEGIVNVNEPAATDGIANVNEPAAADANDVGFIRGLAGGFDFELLARMVELVNGILIVGAILYALTMFFSLLVSLVGRLGGINHISRAFILSLILIVLIVPWQKLLSSSVVGVVYTPGELLQWLATKNDGAMNAVIYYLRFTVLSLVVLLLLLLSHVRSIRWSKAILRRLEII